MFIYNITTKVTWTIHDEWIEWMKEIHTLEVVNTGCFTNVTILRLLDIDENEGPTYAVQYLAESKALYNRYIEKFAPTFRQELFDKWGDNFIAFRSLMQVVN
ncbi:MAG TPA: DUF4286 family protein [Ferruginibacter sp.]|jgi:hypothetical protein|nr:DUF4286 family protein [Ferruginibacter sp.]